MIHTIQVTLPLIFRKIKSVAMKVQHNLSLDELRAKASGWHFAKEMLTRQEHRMLECIEELLKELDSQTTRGYATVWPSEIIERAKNA
jgi:hypothetical protein